MTMNLSPMTYVYANYDPGRIVDSSREGTPSSLKALLDLLPSPALWTLDPRTLLSATLPTRDVALIARCDDHGSCAWMDASRGTDGIELSDMPGGWRSGRLDWNAWPPTLEGEPISAIGLHVLRDVRSSEEHLQHAPVRETHLRLTRAEVDEFVAQFFASDLANAARVLLAGATIGTSVPAITAFLGLSRMVVAPLVRRLHAGRIFTVGGVMARWQIPAIPPFDLMLDAMVAKGTLGRRAPTDAAPGYHLAPPKPTHVCEGEE
jgi:hypothetical protein